MYKMCKHKQQQEQQQLKKQRAKTAKCEQQVVANEPVKRQAGSWQLERKYTLSEVQQHCSLDDCWMVIFDKVYNITEFVDEHPGGDFILLEYAGRDATHPFLSSRHGSSAYKMLDKYWIGILVDEELYYSNNSSYCSVYSNLSWRSSPTLEEAKSSEGADNEQEVDREDNVVATVDGVDDDEEDDEDEDDEDEDDEDEEEDEVHDIADEDDEKELGFRLHYINLSAS